MGSVPVRLYTAGPNQIPKRILEIGACQPPYNRTKSFSNLTFEILKGLKNIFQTEGEVVILTSSGTGAMEATVLGFLDSNHKVLIINGGVFGQRWVDLCTVHGIDFEEMRLEPGMPVAVDDIDKLLGKGSFSALLINSHETSTGVLYDIELIGDVTKRQDVLFVVDAISTICADEFLMDSWHVDVAICSSQKALALPPGLSFVAFNEKAKEKLESNAPKSLYFDLKEYLRNQERGQMPYTPAIGLFMMLHQRLIDIQESGVNTLIEHHATLANAFRAGLSELPMRVLSKCSSNALTALCCDDGVDVEDLIQTLETNYQAYVTPNGGKLKEKVFRVSHMGAQTLQDVEFLLDALGKILSGEKVK